MNIEKTLKAMRNNKRDWLMKDLKAVARQVGMDCVNNGGSHYVFKCHGIEGNISIPAHADIHPDYITKFLRLVDKTIEKNKTSIENCATTD